MLCPRCDKEVAETDNLCGFCGNPISRAEPSLKELPASAVAPKATEEEPPLRYGKATASLVLGLLCVTALGGFHALVTSHPNMIIMRCLLFTGLLAGVLAVIFGHRAKASIRQSSGHLMGKGKATVGLVLGYLGLGSTLLLVAIASFLVLFVANSRMAANQSSAVGSLQRINTAAIIYAEGFGGFPPKLAVLGPAKTSDPNVSVEPSKEAAELLDENLASGRKSNYVFTYVAGPADSAGTIRTYSVHADPAEPGVSGKMYYFTDQTCVIRVEKGKEANQNSPGMP